MKRKLYRYPLYLGLRLVQLTALWLPREAAMALARMIGRLAFWAARREREKTIAHLANAFENEKPPREILKLAEGVFIHYAQVAVDVLRFPRLGREEVDRLVEWDPASLSIFDQVLAEGKGAILLTAHLGNWELMGAFIMLHGLPGAVVARRIYYEKFNRLLVDLRSNVRLKTIYQDAPVKEFLKILNQNHILGILADQDVDRLDGIFVPFFGRPAYTLTSPVKFALATGAPLVPAFLVKKNGRYRLLVEEPIYVKMGINKEETIREYTERWSQVVEAKIREFPDQWAWMHRRWKTAERREAEQTVLHG